MAVPALLQHPPHADHIDTRIIYRICLCHTLTSQKVLDVRRIDWVGVLLSHNTHISTFASSACKVSLNDCACVSSLLCTTLCKPL